MLYINFQFFWQICVNINPDIAKPIFLIMLEVTESLQTESFTAEANSVLVYFSIYFTFNGIASFDVCLF